MSRLRLALLASCVAFPAFAQDVPAIEPSPDMARAVANAQARNAAAMASATGAVNASATATANSTAAAQAVQTGQTAVPRFMPPKIDPVSPDKALNAKEKVNVAVAQRWITKFQKPTLDADGVEHFVAGRGQVFIVTAVDHITDVALAPGETIFPPFHIGDAANWKAHPAMSRAGGKSISHVLIKPTDAGLSTNIVIETNKRTISIALTSRRQDYMPLVALDMGDEEDKDFADYSAKLAQKDGTAAPGSACDQTPVVPPDQFEITGDRVNWRPMQVYQVSTPVGIKTCVDFPSGIGSTALPALLALADDGGWFSGPTKTMVNVRFVNRRFIVDEALGRFVLVDGVGGSQKSVRITRKGT